MFLRIDKVTGVPNSAPIPSSNDSSPLHACLATAATKGGEEEKEGGPTTTTTTMTAGQDAPTTNDEFNASGELFVVGRKNTAITIDDKCVSRKHASIHLLSKTILPHPSASSSSSILPEVLNHGRVGMPLMKFGTPSSPEEIAACDSSPSGVICVLRDLGSKFGTYVQVDEDLIDATTPRTNNNETAKQQGDNDTGGGDETEDETDDEGANDKATLNYVTLTDGQAQAVHLLGNKNNNNKGSSSSSSSLSTPKFIKVEPNKSVILLPLSHSNTNTSTSSSSSPPHVIILLGAIGSAIRLTLLPLQFTFSSISPKSTLQSYIDSLPYIGASYNQWDVNQSTHLVAMEKKANAKAIAAWAGGKSVVTLGYIDGLLGRGKLDDLLPREEDYPPKGTSQLDSLSYSGDHSKALQGYCVAVMMEDDNGPLAQSAGAKFLKVYNAPDTSQADFDNWWNTQQQMAIEGKMVLVLVDSKSSKCKPYSTWLHKRNDVRLTSAKHLAQAITGNNGEGDLLFDSKKEAIEKMEGWDAVVMEEESTKEADKNDSEDVETSEVADGAKIAEEELQHESKEKEAIEGKQPVHAGEKRTKQKEVSEEVITNEQQPEERPPEKKRRRKEQPKESTQEEGIAMETELVEESRDESFDANIDAQSDDEPGLPDERIPLPTTSDGWFVAAPKSRKAYRKAIDEIVAENPLVAAETQRVSGLIVRAYVKPAATTRPGRSTRRGKDFKRFRKNHVIRGFSSSEPNYADFNSSSHNATLPTISLISVLPKESERQRQLEMQQQELEREQEIADNLFNDTGGGGGGKRGRKSGNNSMYQYLTQQSTTKKGRGRR
ncbi:hypothetical protein ACHAWT_004673 [Skeletonema menzelii]